MLLKKKAKVSSFNIISHNEYELTNRQNFKVNIEYYIEIKSEQSYLNICSSVAFVISRRFYRLSLFNQPFWSITKTSMTMWLNYLSHFPNIFCSKILSVPNWINAKVLIRSNFSGLKTQFGVVDCNSDWMAKLGRNKESRRDICMEWTSTACFQVIYSFQFTVHFPIIRYVRVHL